MSWRDSTVGLHSEHSLYISDRAKIFAGTKVTRFNLFTVRVLNNHVFVFKVQTATVLAS
jgi:hypothetical protein